MKPLVALALPPAALLCLFTTTASGDGGFYGDPPDATHPWAVHDLNRPQPAVVTPGTFSSQEQPGTPPSDATILFGGDAADLEKWVSDKDPSQPTAWEVVDGALQCKPGSGYIRTKEQFGDCQLHVEWSAPSKVEGNSQGRGNSGIFLMGQTEVQVLDNYNNPSYADGMAGSVYGVNPPMVNPLRAPGEWQVYDIIFRRPVFDGDQEIDPGYLTVFINGVLVQDHTPLEGGGGHRGRSKPRPFPEAGPLKLQDHGNPVRYRNIWYRPLPKRPIEGGEGSRLSEEATAAKRAEIAASIREDADGLEGKAKMLRLMESLYYQVDPAAEAQAGKMANDYAATVAALSGDELAGKEGEIKQISAALNYLAKAAVLPEDNAARTQLNALIKEQGWDKK